VEVARESEVGVRKRVGGEGTLGAALTLPMVGRVTHLYREKRGRGRSLRSKSHPYDS